MGPGMASSVGVKLVGWGDSHGPVVRHYLIAVGEVICLLQTGRMEK